MKLTVQELARATNSKIEHAQRFHAPLVEAMDEFDINTPFRVAAFLSTVAIETAHLSKVEEDLFYRDPARLVSIYPRAFKTVQEAGPYARNPKGLSDLLYQGYHGRGALMLTWRENYKRASDDLHFDYVQTPALLLEPLHAALTACWFWNRNNCNKAADKRDMVEVTRLVNGPRRLHLVERTALFNSTMDWMA